MFRVPVTVPSASVGSSLTDFPLYIDLASMPAGFWTDLAFPDGRDIRVREADDTEIPFDLVAVNADAETGSLFAKVSLSSVADTTIYVHYGDGGLSAVAPDAANGREAVWSDYHRVYFLSATDGWADHSGNGTPPAQTGSLSSFTQTLIGPETNSHQGVAWDGTHYYTVDSNAIRKWDATWTLIATNTDPCGDVNASVSPAAPTDHCGDPEVVNGVLYIPVIEWTDVDTWGDGYIGLFDTSDLSFISATDITSENFDASAIAYVPDDDMLYVANFETGTTLWKYALSDLSFQGTVTLSTPVQYINGLTYWQGRLWANTDDWFTTENLMWTLATDGTVDAAHPIRFASSTNWEGLGHTDTGLLSVFSTGVGFGRVYQLDPLTPEAGAGARFRSNTLQTGTATATASSVTRFTTWTIGLSVQLDSKPAATQGILSYGVGGSTSNTTRASLAWDQSTDRLGIWNDADGWLEGDGAPTIGATYRMHDVHVSTTSRKYYENGVLKGTDNTITAMPGVSADALTLGVEDTTASQPLNGSIGFAYLRASELSDDWIAAEVLNLQDPATFYDVEGAEPESVRVTQALKLVVLRRYPEAEEEDEEPSFIDGEVSIPLTHIAVTLKDDSAKAFAEVDLNDAADYFDGYKAPWVQEFLPITRGLSDHRGQGEHLSFGAVFSDAAEHYWRTLLDDATNKYLRGRPLAEWMIGDEERRQEELWRLLAAGFVTEYGFPSNLMFELRGGGWLEWRFSRLKKGAQSWQPVIHEDDFGSNTNIDDAVLNTPLQVCYGFCVSTGNLRPGRIVPIYTGQRDGLHEFLISRLACASIDELYVDNVELSSGETDANWYIPGNAKWIAEFGSDSFRDFNSRRYTVIYGDVGATNPDAVAAGDSILAVNVKGVETVGDGTGTEIRSGVDQLLHFLTYFVARPDTSTDVSPYPTASDYVFPHIANLPLIDEASFATAKTDLAARLSSGDYEALGAVGGDFETLDVYEAIARWCVSNDFDWYYNRKGQFAISVEPITAVDSVGTVDDVLTIVENSFAISDDYALHFNVLPWRATPIYGGRPSREGWQRWGTERGEASILNYEQELDCPAFEFWMGAYGFSPYLHARTVLLDAMVRKRCRFQQPMRKAVFEGPLGLLGYEIGDVVSLTHVEGIGASGWVGRNVRISRHEVYPSVGRVRMECYDLEPIWDANGAVSP